jgi:hypothetical protein
MRQGQFLDPSGLVFRAVVALQADVFDIQPLDRVEQVLCREDAVLLMLELRVACQRRPIRNLPLLATSGFGM